MHKIPESDLAAINKQRFLYSLLTMMEPKCKVKQESISFRSDTGHQIDIELQRPLHSEDKICPMVIFYHGGGFVIGNPQMYRHVTTTIASHCNVVVAAVTYRLAPEHKFPAGVEDCLEAAQWLQKNAASLGVDPAQFAVMGDSAGGNLTATVAAEYRDFITLSIPVYPCVTFSNLNQSTVENAEGILLPVSTKLWFDLMHLGAFNSHLTSHRLLAPVSRGPITKPETFPRTHVITAELDILRDEGQYYVSYLEKNSVNVTHKMYRNTPHGFFGASVFPHGREALFDVCAVINSHFSK